MIWIGRPYDEPDRPGGDARAPHRNHRAFPVVSLGLGPSSLRAGSVVSQAGPFLRHVHQEGFNTDDLHHVLQRAGRTWDGMPNLNDLVIS